MGEEVYFRGVGSVKYMISEPMTVLWCSLHIVWRKVKM